MNAYSPRVPATSDPRAIESPLVIDALAQLKLSHRLIEDRFEAHSRLTQAMQRQVCLEAIYASMTVHFTLLTFYFHPAVAFVFDSPAEFARQSIVKYAKLKELLFQLEQLPSDEKLEELRKHFQQHVDEEETVVFPKLTRSPLNLIELGETLHRARQQLESDINAQAEKKTGILALKAPVRRCSATLLRH